MIDVLGIALSVVAVTLLLDPHLPRSSLIGTGVWMLGCAAFVAGHGLFPGFTCGVAALTAGLSVAILAVPVAARFLRVSRGIAGTAAIAAAIGGYFHG